MDTEQLLQDLDRAKKIEKKADRIYTKHLKKILEIKVSDEERKKEIIKVLKNLRDDTQKQHRRIEELKREIIEDKDNDYR